MSVREAISLLSLGVSSGRCAPPAVICSLIALMLYARVLIKKRSYRLLCARVSMLFDFFPHRCDAIHKGFNQKTIVLLAVRKGSIHLVCIVVAMCKGFNVILNVLDHLCLLFERVLSNCHGFGGYVQGF